MDWQKDVSVGADNSDVLQVLDVPLASGAGQKLAIAASGKGQVVLQTVRRFNLPQALEKQSSVFQIEVTYSADKIEVDDLITVSASVTYAPPEPVQAGMVVVDIAVPTGFAPDAASLDQLAKQPKVKRYDVAGRKVIVYVEDMAPGDQVELQFKARALYPVKAQAVTSQAYSYYKPTWKGESLGGAVVVGSAG